MRLATLLAMLVLAAACGGSDNPGGDGDVVNQSSDQQDQQSPTTSPPGDASALPDGATDPAGTPLPVDVTPTTEQVQGVEAPDLGDSSWLVGDYRSPDVGITNVWIVEVTIAFSADGKISGSAGCNDYEGMWTASGPYAETEASGTKRGQELVFESLSWTEIACEDQRVMTQEEEILDILQNTGRWVLLDGELNLLDSEGKFLADAVTTGKHLQAGTPCEGDPPKIDLGVAVNGQVEMAGDWPEVFHFCVEIPGDVSTLTVTLTGITADLGVYVGYPDLETVQNGYADWFSDEIGTDDELVVIGPDLADYLAPGSYYIEVSSYLLSDDPVSSPFTLTVTTS
jgi:heat shock protein HslJ